MHKHKSALFMNQTIRIRWQDFALSIALIFMVWECFVWLTDIPRFILPSPSRVFVALWDNQQLLAQHALVTITEVLIGLLLGSLLGAITALCLQAYTRAQKLLMPVLVISQTIPVFALAPILTLWFGYGLSSKIAMAVLIIYFPVTSTFFDGLRNTPQGFLDIANSMQATKMRTLFFVRVPAALPALASGIRLAAVYAPIGAVIGEWVGASQGLGYLMLLANGRVKIDLLFAALIVLCVFTILLRVVIDRVCHQLEK